jgi:hypothetical protein
MSIRTVNVGMIPDQLEDFLVGYYVEAPPFYTGVRIKITFSGGRSQVVGAITKAETLSYTNEKTFTRIPMERDSATLGIVTASSILENDVQYSGEPYPVSADECRIIMPTWGTNDSFKSRQISKAPVEIYFQTDLYEICGSWTYTDADDSGNNDSGDIMTGFFGWPRPVFVVPAGDPLRTPMTRWIPSTGSFNVAPSNYFGTSTADSNTYLDVTDWDDLQWRSKLGVNTITYGEIHADPSITSTVSVDLEWELLD